MAPKTSKGSKAYLVYKSLSFYHFYCAKKSIIFWTVVMEIFAIHLIAGIFIRACVSAEQVRMWLVAWNKKKAAGKILDFNVKNCMKPSSHFIIAIHYFSISTNWRHVETFSRQKIFSRKKLEVFQSSNKSVLQYILQFFRNQILRFFDGDMLSCSTRIQVPIPVFIPLPGPAEVLSILWLTKFGTNSFMDVLALLRTIICIQQLAICFMKQKTLK